MYPKLSNAYWKVISPRLSLKNYFNTFMSIIYPDLAILLKFFQSEIFFFLAKAVKFILFPSKNSYCFLVAIKEAIILPALLPVIMVGIQLASIKACTTPMWYIPIIAPPLNNSALLPTECLNSPKNYNFFMLGKSAAIIVLRHFTTSSWNSYISFFVALYASL